MLISSLIHVCMLWYDCMTLRGIHCLGCSNIFHGFFHITRHMFVYILLYSVAGALTVELSLLATSKAQYLRSASSGCLQYNAIDFSNTMSCFFFLKKTCLFIKYYMLVFSMSFFKAVFFLKALCSPGISDVLIPLLPDPVSVLSSDFSFVIICRRC